MASRTNSGRGTIEVPRGVKDQFDDYKTALHQALNRRVSNGELIGALLSGVPYWQVDAMLSAYRPQAKSRDEPENNDGV